MMAMGIVLSPAIIAFCDGISVWVQGIPDLRRPVLVLQKMDASKFQEERCGNCGENIDKNGWFARFNLQSTSMLKTNLENILIIKDENRYQHIHNLYKPFSFKFKKLQ